MTKITKKQIASIIKANQTPPTTVTFDAGGTPVEIEVRKRITPSECISYVDAVVSAVFQDELGGDADDPEVNQYVLGKGTKYVAANVKLFTNVALLHFFAGIPMPDAQSGDAMDGNADIVQLACCPDFVKAVTEAADIHQLWELDDAIDSQIEYRKEENLAFSKRQLNDIVRQIQEGIQAIDAGALSESMSDALEVARYLFPYKEENELS